jgi:hypothetical protein
MTRYARTRPELDLSPEVLAAFIRDDVAAIRQALGLQVWDNTPLHMHRDGRCDYCRRPIDEKPGTSTGGCVNNHEMWQLRLRLIAELEARGGGGFTWAHLTDEDDATAAAAWSALAGVADQVGVDRAAFDEIAARAGWYRIREEEHANG